MSEGDNEKRLLYLESILAAVPDAVITLDSEHRVVEWNPGAQRIFGYTPEEAVGQNLDDLVAPEGSSIAEEARAISASVLQQHQVPDTEATRCRRDGSTVEVVLSGAPIVQKGKIVGVVATYKDVGAQKRAERQVGKLLEEKQLLLEEAHHRIKNDMFLIRSMLALQAARTEAGAGRAALEEAGRRVSIIGEMYSGLYRDGGFEWVPLSSVLHRTLSQLRNASEGVLIRITADSGEVAARPAVAIGIVVNELVTNALKHAGRGESLREIVVCVEAQREASNTLLLRVRDNGRGFPELVLNGEGRGLGLDIIASMAEQYDGTVSLRNDEGSVVEVTLSVQWRSPGPEAS